jgi:hypothetical protein
MTPNVILAFVVLLAIVVICCWTIWYWRKIARKDLGARGHVGDPCIYCGIPHDNVPVGDCLSRRKITRR